MLHALDALTRAHAPQVGAKAARLGELAAAGLPVPPGFVLAAEAYHAAVAAHPPLAEAVAAATTGEAEAAYDVLAPLFMRMPLPPELEAGVRAALAGLGEDVAVAVRSSAPGEDGEAASFAGQNATFLNARGPEQTLACIRACWAGAWSGHAAAYRQHMGQSEPPAMAVIVQALVAPEAAGVLFTADPVTGERDRLVVDASWGLGEAVVSGQTIPDRAMIGKADGALLAYEVGQKAVAVVPAAQGTAAIPVAPARQAERALSPAALTAMHTLAGRVEAALGPDQDLEFAWDGERAWLLQARPITALPPPPPPGGWAPPEPGTLWERRNFAEHFPGPLSPLAETLVLPVVGQALIGLAAQIGLTLRAPALQAVHGWAYARGELAKRPDVWLRAPWVYAGLFLGDPANWQRGEPHAARVARRLAARPEAPAALAAWCEALVGEFATTWADVHRLSAGWRWSEHALRVVVGDAALVGRLLASAGPGERGPGQAGDGGAPAEQLEGEVAALAAALDPAARAALAAPEPLAALAALGPAGAEVVGRLAALARAGADLPASFDPAVAPPFGDPAAIAAQVRAAAGPGGGSPGAPTDPVARRARVEAARAEALAAALAVPGAHKRLAVRLLAPWAQRFAAAREPAVATLGHGWSGFRAGLLALGAALAAEGRLSAAEDVFWLPWAEVKALAAGRGHAEPAAIATAVAAARARHAEQAGYAPPLALGAPAERLPAKAILGIPASGGRATGVVRVVHGPEDFAAFAPGEILVAPTTTPAWTPLFGRAAAIVTDVGGPLSHGSIVAREFGIPAVLGTEAATRRLRTGQVVTVDGDRGVIWPGSG